VHVAGHFAVHPSVVVQVSVDWHSVVLVAVQSTHLCELGSQTWCAGSQAWQLAFSLQVI
jgi:hypothetical protein